MTGPDERAAGAAAPPDPAWVARRRSPRPMRGRWVTVVAMVATVTVVAVVAAIVPPPAAAPAWSSTCSVTAGTVRGRPSVWTGRRPSAPTANAVPTSRAAAYWTERLAGNRTVERPERHATISSTTQSVNHAQATHARSTAT